MSIEYFNKTLNESVDTDSNFRRWSDYRDAVTDYIKLYKNESGTCIILGAGNILDINLGELINPEYETVLADIDVKSVEEGIKRLGLAKNISVIKSDLGGLDACSFMKKASLLTQGNDIAGLKKYLETYEFKSGSETDGFNNVMLSSVYTQLFIPQFVYLLQQSSMDDNTKPAALEAALKFTAKLIKHVNDEIIRMAAAGASVCAWSDILEYTEGDNALYDIKNHIIDSIWMDEFYKTYVRDYGHGLGSYGIADLGERLGDLTEKWMIWPFSKKRTLIVKIIAGKVTS